MLYHPATSGSWKSGVEDGIDQPGFTVGGRWHGRWGIGNHRERLMARKRGSLKSLAHLLQSRSDDSRATLQSAAHRRWASGFRRCAETALPMPKKISLVCCEGKPVPACSTFICRPSVVSMMTTAPTASRLLLVPRSRRARELPRPAASQRRMRNCGPVRFFRAISSRRRDRNRRGQRRGCRPRNPAQPRRRCWRKCRRHCCKRKRCVDSPPTFHRSGSVH